MPAETFIALLFGHLVGDYLLQSKKMALNKSNPGLAGWGWCLFHCLVYTAAVGVFLRSINPLVWGIILLTHLPLDRWSLGGLWLKLIRGRTFEAAYSSDSPYREFDIAFTSIVYTIVDNTWHLLLMYFLLPFVL